MTSQQQLSLYIENVKTKQELYFTAKQSNDIEEQTNAYNELLIAREELDSFIQSNYILSGIKKLFEIGYFKTI